MYKPFNCVRFDRLWIAALILANAIPSAHSGDRVQSQTTKKSQTDFSQCVTSDEERTFFQERKRQSAAESEKVIQDSPCRAQEKYRKAFEVGFSESYEARKYFPTFGKYKLHSAIMARIEKSNFACTEFEQASSEERACCLSGYTYGEASFKEKLRKAPVQPAQCGLAFAQGLQAGSAECRFQEGPVVANADKCRNPTIENAFAEQGCQYICFSFGWNEGVAPCLTETISSEKQHSRSNRSIQFQRAYQPVETGGHHSGASDRSGARSAR